MSDYTPPGSPEPPEMNQEAPVTPRGSWLPEVRTWARDLFISLFLAGMVIVFLYQPVKVEGTSMAPQLTDQERVFINKFIYRLEPIERGDVVVFRLPADVTKSYIKRVVGVPGDRVEMRAGEMVVNGTPLAEPYLSPSFRGRDTFAPVIIPPGEYFVLGDHRNASSDSRAWGTVPQRFIFGKAGLTYWPVGKWGLLD